MTAKRKAAAVLVGLLIAGLLALIWFFSAQPGPQSNALSQAVQSDLQQNGLSSLTPGLGLLGAQQAVRKWAHTYIYLLLGGLCAAFCRLLAPLSSLGPRAQHFALPLVFCTAAAACDEWHQYFVPGRSCEVRDVALDVLGALAGILLLAAASRIFYSLKTKLQGL